MLRWYSKSITSWRTLFPLTFNPSRRLVTTTTDFLRRSYLYVPSSSDRMLEKSLSVPADVIIYDLEDSLPPVAEDKFKARRRLEEFLNAIPKDQLPPNRIAVRVNDINTPFFEGDLAQVLRTARVGALVLPKIRSVSDLDYVSGLIRTSSCGLGSPPLKLIASLESAVALWNLREIVTWKAKSGDELGGVLSATLFGAEDYCADTSIIRTTSRLELLYTRSCIVAASKAFGLDAIDMVCVDYNNIDYLREECEEGRRLGFTGKQVIHPSQISIVNSGFVPTSEEILRAARIVHRMHAAHTAHMGAFGLDSGHGGKEMIDLPMLKQAQRTIRKAEAAGLEIPVVD